jgi:hypothetical protein
MQYQVPQFIEIEDKIFGPFTLKQFIYLAGGGGVTLLFYTLFPFFLAMMLAVPFVALALGLAFYKVNDRPLIITLEHGFKYFLSSKLYLWKAQPHKVDMATEAAAMLGKNTLALPNLSESKLKDLSWSLNIKDRTQMGVVDPDRPELAI